MIGTSSFSNEWLLGALTEADNKFEGISEVKSVKEISGGKGFASKVYLCDVGGSSVVLKVPDSGKLDDVCQPGEEKPGELPNICWIHDREVDFYDKFGDLNLIPTPKIYKTGKFGPMAKDPAFLLMESLATKGELGSLVDGFSRLQLLSMARDFARFQAHFLRLNDRSWTEKFPPRFPGSNIQIMTDLLKKTAQMNPALFAEGIEKLLPLVGNREFMYWTSFTAYENLNLPPVLVHGNLWTNNIFWKKNPDGSVGNEVTAYIDWQLAHAGCLTSDISHVLVLCAEADVRRQFTDEILHEYYLTLSKTMGKPPPFTLEQAKELYEVNFFAQVQNLLFTVVFLPVMIAHLPLPVQEVQVAKLQSRAKFAMDDCLANLNDLKQKFDKM